MKHLFSKGGLSLLPRTLLALALCCGAALTAAQTTLFQPTIDPDWKESEAPPPPAFNKNELLPIDMPRFVGLRFGVDPDTLSITPDGIVRYVMVAANDAGSINAMYEGIRCATGEVKTYARWGSSGQWNLVQEPVWQELNDNLRSRHALALARQGACDGRATTANTVADIVKVLKGAKPAPAMFKDK